MFAFVVMSEATYTGRDEFIDRVLTSSIPGEVAKRFAFADGEVGVLHTTGRNPATGQACSLILYVATFPPSSPREGVRDFGLDYFQQPVATAEEAAQVLAHFGREQAEQFRRNCRPLPGVG